MQEGNIIITRNASLCIEYLMVHTEATSLAKQDEDRKGFSFQFSMNDQPIMKYISSCKNYVATNQRYYSSQFKYVPIPTAQKHQTMMMYLIMCSQL